MYFRSRPFLIARFLKSWGYTGTLKDMLLDYFGDLAGSHRGTLFDRIEKYLVSEGYTGTLNDKLRAFFKAEMLQEDYKIAENLYWSNVNEEEEVQPHTWSELGEFTWEEASVFLYGDF